MEHPENELPKVMTVSKNGFACSQCLGRFARRRSQGMVFARSAIRKPCKFAGNAPQNLNMYGTLGGIPCITLERQRFQGPLFLHLCPRYSYGNSVIPVSAVTEMGT